MSATVLEATILPAGTIIGTARRAPALLAARVILAALGGYLLYKRPRLTVVHLAALAFGSGVAGVAGALFLQVAYVPPPIVSGWRAFASASEQNQLGFRGRTIAYAPEDYVVLLLGDSQVEAMAMGMDAMPERRLEAHLNALGHRAKVFSMGAGGYGQDQELLALEQYFEKYRADLVLLWQTPGNDIWNNVFKTHMAGRNPKPTYWLDEGGRLSGPSEALGQPLANSPVIVAALFQRTLGLPWRDRGWEHRLPPPYEPMARYDGPVSMEWQDRWDRNIGRMRDENLDTEKSHLAVGLTPRSKRMQYGLDLTRSLIDRIHALVASHDGRFVAFQVSTDSDDGDESAERVYLLNKKYYRVSKEQVDANWREVNKNVELEVVPTTVQDWRVGPEDGHLNERATDQVMADLAKRLKRVPGGQSTSTADPRSGA